MSLEQYIPGIFNYCDRWCEKCNATEYCRLYAREQKNELDTGEIDEKHLYRQIEQSLKESKELVEQEAAKRGIDLDTLVDDTDFSELADRQNRAEKHDLFKYSRDYYRMTHKLLEIAYKNTGGFEKTVDSQPINGNEAIEVITFYSLLIHSKIVRSLTHDPEFDEVDQPNDAEGSAKVALIGIKKSMAAWSSLVETKEYVEEDDALDQIGLLKSIEDLLQKEFPAAEGFFRPGLD